MDQAKAIAFLKSGRNVFLTGSAGTGKTYVLNQYINYLRERKVPVAVTASTGLAATHLNGQTIHSWSGIGIKDQITSADLRNLLNKKYLKKNFDTVKVLIIDEVSMLHKGQLAMVDEILRYARQSFEAFGGVQLVLSGDFFQLPPISRTQEPDREKFAFMSRSWLDAELTICYLTEQYRQSDDELNGILNAIRSRKISDYHTSLLQEQTVTHFKAPPTRLYTHNVDVDRINQEEIDALSGISVFYDAELKGNEKLRDALAKTVLAPERLQLKKGAKVMFVKNNFEKGYINGTTGVVAGFDSEKDYPIVETPDGGRITAIPEDWSIQDENGKAIASFVQVPLRLAWAITVHKSQGMTLDSAEIDLSKTFERGQGYVALSRLKSLDGLKLLGLNEMALEINPLAFKADERFQVLSAEVDRACDLEELESEFKPFLVMCGGLTSEKDIQKNRKKRAEKKKKEIHLRINPGTRPKRFEH